MIIIIVIIKEKWEVKKEKCLLSKYLKEKGKNKINGNILTLWLTLTWKTKGSVAETVTRTCFTRKVL